MATSLAYEDWANAAKLFYYIYCQPAMEEVYSGCDIFLTLECYIDDNTSKFFSAIALILGILSDSTCLCVARLPRNK